MNEPVLWYFADPMCSWCWGFSPVIEAIRENYREHMRVALILGGLRPGTTRPMPPKEREEILHHWHQVHATTGQSFHFDGILTEGFIYDTEPASRAVVAMAELNQEAIFPLFKLIQAAFYAHGHDVTQLDVLVELAHGLGADKAEFLAAFGSETVKDKTQAHFQMAHRLNVRGFPTLVLMRDGQHQVLSNGYRPWHAMQQVIDACLAADDTGSPAAP